MEEGGKARDQAREGADREAGEQKLTQVIRERAECYLTLAICEDTGSRKFTDLGKSHSLGLPVQAGHECLKILLRTVFMRQVKALGLPDPRTGVQTGVGQQVLIQRLRYRE